jgi:hypothetical protein
VRHARDANELLEVAGNELRTLSEMMRGFASGYFSLARCRITSISVSRMDSRRSQCTAESH